MGAPAARASPGRLSRRLRTLRAVRQSLSLRHLPLGRHRRPGADRDAPYFTPDILLHVRDILRESACPTGRSTRSWFRHREEGPLGSHAESSTRPHASTQGLRCGVCLRECPETGKGADARMHRADSPATRSSSRTVRPDASPGADFAKSPAPRTSRDPGRRPGCGVGAIGKHYRLSWLPSDDPKNLREEVPEKTPSSEEAGASTT